MISTPPDIGDVGMPPSRVGDNASAIVEATRAMVEAKHAEGKRQGEKNAKKAQECDPEKFVLSKKQRKQIIDGDTSTSWIHSSEYGRHTGPQDGGESNRCSCGNRKGIEQFQTLPGAEVWRCKKCVAKLQTLKGTKHEKTDHHAKSCDVCENKGFFGVQNWHIVPEAPGGKVGVCMFCHNMVGALELIDRLEEKRGIEYKNWERWGSYTIMPVGPEEVDRRRIMTMRGFWNKLTS